MRFPLVLPLAFAAVASAQTTTVPVTINVPTVQGKQGVPGLAGKPGLQGPAGPCPTVTSTGPVKVTMGAGCVLNFDSTALQSGGTATVPVGSSGNPVATPVGGTTPVTTPVAGQQTWYVRADGGTRYSSNVPDGQCDGLADAAYPGSGTNLHCAFSDGHFFYQDGSYALSPQYPGTGNGQTFPAIGWVGKGGDTYVFKGSIAEGTQRYRITGRIDGTGNGNSLPNAPDGAGFRGWSGDPYTGMPSPPAGTAAAPTMIVGEHYASCTDDSAKTPVMGGWDVSSVINVSTPYVTFACLDITDGAAPNPTGNWKTDDAATVGLSLTQAATHLTLTDLRIHGIHSFGLAGAPGDGFVATRVKLLGNGAGGWNADPGDGTTGVGNTLFQDGEISWNGCEEDPAQIGKATFPYTFCHDQSSGGYGDGFGTTTVTSVAPWHVRFLRNTVSYNTQDGLDALHLVGGGSSMDAENNTIYGNMGQQLKDGGDTGTAIGNTIVGNCDAMANAIPGTAAGYNSLLTDFCRAGNVAVLMSTNKASTTTFTGNTLLYNGTIGLQLDCTTYFCDTTALVDVEGNNFLGYPDPTRGNPALFYLLTADDTYLDQASCNAAPHHYWGTTSDGLDKDGCVNNVFANAGSVNSGNFSQNVKPGTDEAPAKPLPGATVAVPATMPLYGSLPQ